MDINEDVVVDDTIPPILTARDVTIDLTGDDEIPSDNIQEQQYQQYQFNPDDALSESRIEEILNNMEVPAAVPIDAFNVDFPTASKLLTEQQENDISMFCDLTGSERSYAQTMLEVRSDYSTHVLYVILWTFARQLIGILTLPYRYTWMEANNQLTQKH